MATRKTPGTVRKAAKKTARKAAKKAAKKTAGKSAKKAAKKAVRKAPRKAAKKTASKRVARKAATKKAAAKKTAASKAPARKAARKAGAKKAATKKTAAAKSAATKAATKKTVSRKLASKAAARKSPRRAQQAPQATPAARTVRSRKPGGEGVTKAELAQRRRAARTDAATTVAASDGTSANFGTTTAASPRSRDRGTSRTNKRHRITPEEALANTRALLEAKQARDRETPPWRQLDEAGTPAAATERDSVQEAQANAKAEELHRAESRLDAIHGSISEQDRHRQGRRDARE